MSQVITLSLNSFVKLYNAPRSSFRPQVEKLIYSNGGFNYYNYAQRAIKAHINKRPQDEIDVIFESIDLPNTKEENLRVYNNYLSRFKNKKNVSLAHKRKKLNLGNVSVLADPLFSHESKDIENYYHVWYSKYPLMSQEVYGVGLHILNRAYKGSNAKFHFFDCRNGKVYSKYNSNNIAQSFDDFVKSLNEVVEGQVS